MSAARVVVAAVAGAIFAFGLALAGMTDPAKIIGFLDVTGHWDPSLAFVMGGAVGVHFFAARWAKRAKQPVLGGTFDVPKPAPVDAKLLAGAAIFGAGWGASGYCPGPALVGAASLAPTTCLFVVAMLAGTAAYRFSRPASAERIEGL